MRTRNSLKNIYISIFSQIIIIMLGFISRRIFIDSLGAEYLGVNGLLTNVLSMLSLVEGGIGASIVYNLYKPLAEENKDKIIALVQLYKKLYGLLAIIVFLLSIALYPFLGSIIKEGQSIFYITIVYFIFVLRNIVSYLNAHKWSLINADQKGYVLARANLIFDIFTTISKLIILMTTKNYILYLLIEVGIFIIQNIYNGRIVNKRYPYIKTKEKHKVDNKTKDNLITNVKAIFMHKIGSFCVFGTDNILISAFVNIKTVGLYSNYTMIIGQLSALVTPILNSVSASVGNLVAVESEEKNYQIFNVIYLVNFWIYAISAIFLYNLLEPFIDWWIGKGFLLDNLTFLVVIINFYISGLRSSIGMFKEKAGIFKEDKYVPLVESVVNLGSSIILIKYLGLAGIFIGTTISTVTLPLWNQPRLVYKKLFKKPSKEYFIKYIEYALLTISSGFLTTITCNLLVKNVGFIPLVLKGIICLIIPNIIFIAVFYKTDEFKYIYKIINGILNNLKTKLFRGKEVIQ